MKLSLQEKKEMLCDAKNKKRKLEFRKGVVPVKFNTFEKYISWLDALQSFNPIKQEKRIVTYKNVKI
ncbi:MAG: hypothetical protein V2A57_00940 [Elusimicrobiota bacterium]